MPYDFGRGEDIVEAMHDRYVTRWPRTLVYVQHNQLTPRAGAPTASVWLTAVQPPQRVRIDIDPREQGNGLLIVGDTQYVITGGRPSQVIRQTDPATLLQHDVYFLTPPETIARLRALGVDLSAVRQDQWQGRAVFVLGRTGRSARELWIDRELMLIVRLLEPSPRDPSITMDTRFHEYERLGSAWVPRRIESLEDNERIASRELRQIRSNLTLDSLLFRPDDWTRARHWYQSAILR